MWKCITLLLAIYVASTAAILPLKKSPLVNGGGYFIILKPFSTQIYSEQVLDAKERFLRKVNTHGRKARMERRQAVFDYYTTLTEHLQSSLLQSLQSLHGLRPELDYETFWIDQSVFIRPHVFKNALVADRLLNFIGEHPHVETIVPNDVIAEIIEPVFVDEIQITEVEGRSWGVNDLRASEAWSITKGEGVRVALIDTGVNIHHQALTSSYAGFSGKDEPFQNDYNWFDPLEFRNDEWWCTDDPDICMPRECCLQQPFDNVGHGSHVAGTIAGSRGIGVAPGATWMAAKGCRDGNCLRYGLLKSAQWVVCPTRVNGTDPDCSKGADIVNNSWGSKDGKDDFYEKYIKVWREADILPVFANGNMGPNCGAISAPGDFKMVMGIGATNIDRQLASFSSRGPGPVRNETSSSLYAHNKPDFSAPGVKILSALARTNDSYVTMSGTSMATPHVSGVLALVLSVLDKDDFGNGSILFQDPWDTPFEDTYSKIYQILKLSVNHTSQAPIGGGGRRLPLPPWPERQTCDGQGYNVWPNLFYGHGLVDAYQAVLKAQQV